MVYSLGIEEVLYLLEIDPTEALIALDEIGLINLERALGIYDEFEKSDDN